MNTIRTAGKFLDQPMLVAKFQKTVPALLTAGAAVYTAIDCGKEKDGEKRKKRALKTGITLAVTAASALAAPKIASVITKRPLGDTFEIIKEKNIKSVDTFIKNTQIDDKTKTLLEKSKTKILKFSQVRTLYEKIGNSEKGRDFLEKLIPSPVNISAKDIFSEIGFLSINGAIPVAGGIAGGILADKITDKKHWKEKIPDKIKEGSYQYLANIFMCNVGAGIALGILEKAGIKSKAARAAGMTAGIILTGIIGGSKIANLFSEKVIEPCLNRKQKKNINCNFSSGTNLLDIYEQKSVQSRPKDEKSQKHERTPEILDVGLHLDDIATVSLLSGLKWIEPALPIMYSISGYRAGSGYRN